ncbi:MAG TPA: thioredoxin family protein [Steroidobacteraceae bacterium]|nr:thioredoxin family protein [Steroidobacteraceae bacterium]
MTHRVVSGEEWLAARRQLLTKEKEFTRLRDQLSALRRELPWEAVTREYLFEGPDGRQTLPQLFAGRRQLIVYHFMFAPDWDAGCPHCSHWADNFNGGIVHLNQRDVTMVAVSRAPYPQLAAYEKRMGWSFKWMSSHGSDFNFDYRVSFSAQELQAQRAFYNYAWQDPGVTDREGVSVFFKDEHEQVFHTYSAYARGIDLLNTDYNLLDLTPNGRDEAGRGPFWVRRHDEYDP